MFVEEPIKILDALLDRGEWKHTWHMPKDQYGNVDHFHPDGLKMIREQIKEAREQARNLLALADNAETILKRMGD